MDAGHAVLARAMSPRINSRARFSRDRGPSFQAQSNACFDAFTLRARLETMTRTELLLFIREHSLGVVATKSPSGQPQASVVGIAVSDAFEILFDTLANTRKVQNLRHSPEVACVVGWDEEQTVQIEGIADEPQGHELLRLQRHYFAQFPDGRVRLAWPGITYVRIRPNWIRYSDFRDAETETAEFSGSELFDA